MEKVESLEAVIFHFLSSPFVPNQHQCKIDRPLEIACNHICICMKMMFSPEPTISSFSTDWLCLLLNPHCRKSNKRTAVANPASGTKKIQLCNPPQTRAAAGKPLSKNLYACYEWQSFLKSHSQDGSMSRCGNCHNNVVAESFFQLLKHKQMKENFYGTLGEARSDIFDYSEIFYNSKCQHGSNDNIPPIEYEN